MTLEEIIYELNFIEIEMEFTNNHWKRLELIERETYLRYLYFEMTGISLPS